MQEGPSCRKYNQQAGSARVRACVCVCVRACTCTISATITCPCRNSSSDVKARATLSVHMDVYTCASMQARTPIPHALTRYSHIFSHTLVCTHMHARMQIHTLAHTQKKQMHACIDTHTHTCTCKQGEQLQLSGARSPGGLPVQ